MPELVAHNHDSLAFHTSETRGNGGAKYDVFGCFRSTSLVWFGGAALFDWTSGPRNAAQTNNTIHKNIDFNPCFTLV